MIESLGTPTLGWDGFTQDYKGQGVKAGTLYSVLDMRGVKWGIVFILTVLYHREVIQ